MDDRIVFLNTYHMNIPRLALRLLCASAVVFTSFSCTKEDPLKPPVDVKNGDWQNVPKSGATIEQGALVIEIPSGTFAGDTQIAVSEAKKGAIAGSQEKSPFYQLTFKAGGSKGAFKLKLNYEGKADEVQPVIKMPTLCSHSGQSRETIFPVAYSVSGNDIVIDVPEIADAGDLQPFFTIGLVENSNIVTKATNPSVFFFTTLSSANKAAANKLLNSLVPDAFDDLRTLGFKPNFWFVGMTITEFEPEEAGSLGLAESNPYVTAWGYMRLNKQEMERILAGGQKKEDVNLLRQTLVHEFFHLIHDQFYDTQRYALLKHLQGAYGDEWAMLSEAIGTWTEKITGNKMIGDISPVNAERIVHSLFITGNDQLRYRAQGYSFALFIEYLSQLTSNKKIVTILEYQKGGAKTVKEAIDKFLDANKLKFFNENDYMTFLLKLLNGEIDSRVSAKGYTQFGAEHKMKTAAKISSRDTINCYGANLHYLNFNYTESLTMLKANSGKELKISQKAKGLITRVYYLDDKYKYRELGNATAEQDFTLPVDRILGIQKQYKTPLAIMTMKAKQTSDIYGITMSNLTIEFAEPDKNLPIISSIEFGYDLWYSNKEGKNNICPYPTTWSTSYDNIISVTKNGKGLIVKCDNSRVNYQSYVHATISFYIDSYSGGKCGAVSKIVYDYEDKNTVPKWHLEIESLPLEKNEVSMFNGNEAIWRAKGNTLKVTAMSYTSSSNKTYSYLQDASNTAYMIMEYK